MLLVLAALAASPTVYRLDPAQGALYVLVSKDPATVGSALAHDHVVVASGWNGRVAWGDGACSVGIEVPVRSLVVDAPTWRTRLGLEKAVSERQRGQVRASMLDEGQLHADAHPAITFQSETCVPAGEFVSVQGNLTLRGVTRPVTVPMKVTAEGGRLHATGRFTIKATDFGFEPYSAFLGAVKNRDEMELVVDVVGTSRAPS